MKKSKPTKAALSGNAKKFANVVDKFASTGKHPHQAEMLALLTIEEVANKIQEAIDDRKLANGMKFALIRNYTSLIQECVIDATSFKFQINK